MKHQIIKSKKMLFYYSWRFLEVALKSADCTDLFFNYNVKILAIFIWPFFIFWN